MIVAIPTGAFHGWGIAGTHLTRELYRLPPVEGVTLHCMKNPDFEPSFPEQWSRRNIGYCFFENDIDAYRFTGRAAERYDHIIAGSSWCEHHLRIGGVEKTSTILQGIEPAYFHATPPRADDGRFIVFSGGKFELRKSQDVVIAAMKVMMERHKDVWLSFSWHNIWPFSVATMAGSPLIRFDMEELECGELIRKTVALNGMDMERVIMNPLTPNNALHLVYEKSDIGFFPNRCEGGNNMVMCEYMACGRPVVASSWTGHADVISEENAFALRKFQPRVVSSECGPSAIWFDPDLEEAIESLEYAYNHRNELPALGMRAAESMKRLSWPEAARSFYKVACAVGDSSAPVSSATLKERGAALIELQDFAEAERHLRQALQMEPLNADIYQVLSLLYKEMGRDGESAFCRNKSEMLSPGQQSRGIL